MVHFGGSVQFLFFSWSRHFENLFLSVHLRFWSQAIFLRRLIHLHKNSLRQTISETDLVLFDLTGPMSPEKCSAIKTDYCGDLCVARVPTRIGKSGKFWSQKKIREFWTNWKSQGILPKILKKWGNFGQNTGQFLFLFDFLIEVYLYIDLRFVFVKFIK